MRKFTVEEINKILENHKHWIKRDCSEWEKMRANLYETDLRRADLSGANLSGANLRRANLYETDLRRADLSGANFNGADFSETDLRRANLSRANLSRADFSGANLRGANLSRADFSGANLRGANLSGANLCGTNLHGSNLCGTNLCGTNLSETDFSGANLSRADFSGANLSEAKNIPFIPSVCPDSGCFIGWKKASGYIVKLFIPADAKRSSATGRKCRCDKATVVAIEKIDGTPADVSEVCSDHDPAFIYKNHGHVSVKDFDDDRFNECAPGIHFFINRQEAVEY